MIAIDTSIVIYAEGINDAERREAAKAFLDRLKPDVLLLPAQVLGELYWVLVRKGRRTPREAEQSVALWRSLANVTPTTEATLAAAIEVAGYHGLQIWDAIILCSAQEAGARVLISEDMQHGFFWNGVTVVNPFAPAPHESLLAPYLMRDD